MKLFKKSNFKFSVSFKKKIISACFAFFVLLIALVILIATMHIPTSIKKPQYSLSALVNSTDGEFVCDDRAPEGMKLVCENKSLALFYNEQLSQMAVLHKASGEYWHANPENPEEDSIAAGAMAGRLRSAINITYYTSDDMSGTLNSYQACVETENLKYEFIENGIRLIYQMGNNKIEREMLPAVIEKDKFESKILSKLSDNEKQSIKQFYKLQKISDIQSVATVKKYEELYTTIDKDKKYYFLDLYTPEYKLGDIYDYIFKIAEYTLEDVEQDNKSVGSTAEIKSLVSFTIPVEYTLNGDAFKVNIPAKEIEIPAGLVLNSIQLLPFFGAAGLDDEGYIVTPDGSGSIVEFNTQRKSGFSYSIPIYGNDAAIRQVEQNFNSASANIPVFGIVYKDKKGMLAIIEQGESHATLDVEIAGVNFDRTYISPTFELHPMDVEVIADTKYDVSSNLYQEEMYQGNITVSYMFTGANKADYASLAVLCRDYLKKQGILPDAEDTATLSLKLTAKTNKSTSFVGIPYNKDQSVTTLKQAKEIVTKLKEQNVDSLNVGYGSWFGGGLRHDAINGKVSLSGGLGGRNSVKNLLNELDGYGKLSLSASVQRVYKGIPQFNYFTNAVRLLNNEVANGYFYNPSTYQPEERDSDFYYLSPRYLQSVVGDYTASAKRLGVNSIWLDDIGSVLSSDFSSGKNIDREVSKALVEQALCGISESTGITASNPNMYVWKYIDTAVNIPNDSSNSSVVKRSIPFLQIVLSGSLNYSSEAFNRSGNDTECLLKAVETGSDIYYEWIYASDFEISSLDGIETEKLYSMCYEGWLQIASEQYTRIKNELSGVCGKEIIGHSLLEEKVYKTEYQGADVIVNYNYNDVTIDGKTVPARDFIVIKEEG